MALFKNYMDFNDVVSLLAFSPSDTTFMLVVENLSTDYWIPTARLPSLGSCERIANQEIVDIFGAKLTPDKMMRLYRLWAPGNPYFRLHNFVFEVRIDQEAKKNSKNTIGKYKNRIRWVSESELTKLLQSGNLKSPDLWGAFMCAKNKTLAVHEIYKAEGMSIFGNLVEYTEEALVLSSTSVIEQTVVGASFEKDFQTVLYREFLSYCYPCCFMGMQAFTRFTSELGWTKDETMSLFRAADFQSRYGLTFREFLALMASTETGLNLTGVALDYRNKLMFRFFDRDRDGVLKTDELRNVVMAIRKGKKQSVDSTNVGKELIETYKMFGLSESTGVPQQDFLKAVTEGRLKGTNNIFHSPMSLREYIKDSKEKSSGAALRRFSSPHNKNTLKALQNKFGVIDTSKTRITRVNDYEFAWHTIKIRESGAAINVDQLFGIEEAISPSSTKQPSLADPRRKLSMDQFNQESVTNSVLKGIRYLNQVNRRRQSTIRQRNTFNWGQLDPDIFAGQFMQVCHLCTDIFKNEARMIQMNSPVYIMGDLHGNFTDLLYFEKVLWHVGPGLCPCNILFLGDYVDRGPNGMEVIGYLFSYKIQNPQKLRLLRGNHEIRDVQKMFTFFSECHLKFGERVGTDVWNAINNAFDNMPIAAVIDQSIFCCHGGIPPPWLCPVISAINDIPVPLNQPDEQSALAWEIMWNDPVKSKTVTERLAMEMLANEGFAMNVRRGTAHIFSSDALEKFLKSNGLTHLIRAHEVASVGFYLQQKGKMLTVFSSSKYCGGQNDAACVLADQAKLRILRLETD